MNYRHVFHAGNHADVFKHLVLSRLIALLSRKDSPFAYLDTHAGIGLYDLYSDQAERTGEWLTGIKPLNEQVDQPELMANYLEAIKALNTTNELRYYPGSPWLAQQLMRPQDRIILNEMHPEDVLLLKQNFKKDQRISIHNQNGWLLPKALLPLPEKRLLILIDPPFEKDDDLTQCFDALTEIIKRTRQAIVAIWYPIKDKKELLFFYKKIAQINVPKLLKVEFLVQLADNSLGLNGSGMLIANPPWKLDEELGVLLPYLRDKLAETSGSYSVEWLVEERN